MKADEILARLLELNIEHPRYLHNGMLLCYWCGHAWMNADVPANHSDDCPWRAAREWGKKQRNSGPRAKAGAQVTGGRNPHDELAPTPRRTTPAFADGPARS